MPTSLGPAEILVILVVALIVLGPKRLPEAGRQVGRAIAEVRKWSQSFQDEIRSAVDFDTGPPSYPTPPAGTQPSPLPMVPAETGPPPDPPSAATPAPPEAAPPPPEAAAPAPPPAASNGSSNGTVTTGSHGLVSGPPPPDLEPPAGDPPAS